MRGEVGVTLIEVLVGVVIVGVLAAIVVLVFRANDIGGSYYCEGPNGVYPGYDYSRPPTVVVNDPNCRTGAS